MPWELTPAIAFVLIVLIVAVRRYIRRPHGFATTALPDVADAPPAATPIASPRLKDDGLGTYSLDLPDSDR